MILSRISEEDKSKVARVFVEYWRARGMPQYNERWAKEYLETGHKKEIEEDEFFVYKESEKVIGVVSFVTDVSGLAEIRDLVIDEKHKDKDCEKDILEKLIDIARQKNLHKIYELIFPELREMYESLGFEKEGFLKSHFTENEDLVIMSKFL